ncbi:type II NADH:ubiquinone oxidoreductase, putative [Plasmodium malariae]|uniref:NADH:ubiquinone reductase (non-electrogenic) n=1 Tax=Plasmodium malariae TaxID=5858 RepID=A0A1C3KBL8_PLAMA|nr:type II NADH:ubiquinone oxidoreductase, putative [Plasmodium malariae]
MLMNVRKNKINNLLRKIKYTYEKNWMNDGKENKKKEKVLVLGSGWGGINFLLNIDFNKYDVTLISPRNYFTFTPLLPCLCCGTLSVNACRESVSRFLKKNGCSGNYLQLECTDIMYKEKYVKCVDSNNEEVNIMYDYLIIAVGAKTNSFNIKGVEKYALFVKDVDDALRIRRKFLENLEMCTFEKNNVISDEKKKYMLHVVIVGGGPTGVEVAGEFADFVNKEIRKKYEDIFPLISISIIEGGNNLLPTFTQSISDFTKNNFKNLNINVLTNYYVTEVDEQYFTIQSSVNKNEKKKIPYGLIIWASGLAQTPLVNNFLKKIPEQVNNKILNVNSQLNVIGINTNNIFAIGDCKKIQPLQLHQHTNEIIQFLNCSKLTSDTLKIKAEKLSMTFPQVSESKWDYIKNKTGDMNEQQFHDYLYQIDQHYKSPSPTAQNAKQEARYLSHVFNHILPGKNDQLLIPSFQEKWKGSLAYIGNHQAVANLPFYEIKGGLFSFTFWRMVYIQLLLTWKTRYFFFVDSLRTRICGRSFVK